MSDLSTRPPQQQPPGGRDYWSQTPPWYVIGAGLVLIAIFVAVLLLLVRDDDSQIQTVAPTLTTIDGSTSPTLPPAGETSSTTEPAASSTLDESTTTSTTASTTATSASTTATTTSSTATTIDPEQFRSAVWPEPASSVRYSEPEQAAEGFAEDFLGFQDPLIGPFRQGDSQSGEVEFRPTETGPATTVLVRRLGPAGTWWVLGSVTENIVIAAPDALDEIDSPLTITGSALAFEGVVDVELRADGRSSALIEGSVVGGGTALEPFEDSFEWTNPGEGAGTLILMTTTMEDGRAWEAAVVRVTFGAS